MAAKPKAGAAASAGPVAGSGTEAPAVGVVVDCPATAPAAGLLVGVGVAVGLGAGVALAFGAGVALALGVAVTTGEDTLALAVGEAAATCGLLVAASRLCCAWRWALPYKNVATTITAMMNSPATVFNMSRFILVHSCFIWVIPFIGFRSKHKHIST
jgi:hypothetical protein